MAHGPGGSTPQASRSPGSGWNSSPGVLNANPSVQAKVLVDIRRTLESMEAGRHGRSRPSANLVCHGTRVSTDTMTPWAPNGRGSGGAGVQPDYGDDSDRPGVQSEYRRAMVSHVRALVREPLLHFLVVGLALFGLDRAANGGGGRAPGGADLCALPVPTGPIVVDAAVRRTLAGDWSRRHEQPADAAVLERLTADYIDREVLYREGLTRGLAVGDARVRDRVADQMAYVLDEGLTIAEPDRATLRAWFQGREASYAEPERVDFTQVFVQGRDAAAEARALELLRQLEGGASPGGLGDTFWGGRTFRGRKLDDLTERFGEAFTAGLRLQEPGAWSLLRSEDGLHLVRVDRWAAGRAPAFDAVHERVRHDWEQVQRERGRREALVTLREHWAVAVSP